MTRQETQALGDEEVAAGEIYLPKKEGLYELWNRLVGETNPARTKQAPK